ncbi:hypothetical protein P4W16_25125, partial [Bacillus thuringiensis]|nr:hypothetical protein [Bacillus thuringiensis]
MKKLFLIAIACIIIGVIGISQTYEKAVQTAEKGDKEDVIKNETLKNIEVKLDAGDIVIQKSPDSSFLQYESLVYVHLLIALHKKKSQEI